MYQVPLWSNAIHQVLRILLLLPQPPLEVQGKLYHPYHRRGMDVSGDLVIHSTGQSGDMLLLTSLIPDG